MAKKTYLWIEDRENKSGHTFWKNFLYNIFPDVILESKENNSKLLKAVRDLTDDENTYIIAYDHSFDNPQVVREMRMIAESARTKKNVLELDIICFEFILLEFKKLIDWIYAPEDEFLTKRRTSIVVREKLLEAISKQVDYKSVDEIIKYVRAVDEYNIEQLSAKILFELTRNTGFEVAKGNLGQCWVVDCCDWNDRKEDDVCGLDENRISVREKILDLYQMTSLRSAFQKCGLEVH